MPVPANSSHTEFVALLTEGVDRNIFAHAPRSSRSVALLTEGVDRNVKNLSPSQRKARRPPHGGRG